MPRNRGMPPPLVQTPLAGVRGRALLLPAALTLGGVSAALVIYKTAGPAAGTAPLLAVLAGLVAAYLAAARRNPRELSRLVGFGAAVALLALTAAGTPALRTPAAGAPRVTQAGMVTSAGALWRAVTKPHADPVPAPRPKATARHKPKAKRAHR